MIKKETLQKLQNSVDTLSQEISDKNFEHWLARDMNLSATLLFISVSRS